MRRYRVGIDGRTHVVDVDELDATTFHVRAGDREFTVTLSVPEDIANPVIRPAPPETLRSIIPAAPPRLPPSPDRNAAAAGAVKAPMPGTVMSVDVAAGAQVRTGDLLLKLEAMKMVNAIRSPRDGVVADVPVQAGQSVGYGHVLVLFAEK